MIWNAEFLHNNQMFIISKILDYQKLVWSRKPDLGHIIMNNNNNKITSSFIKCFCLTWSYLSNLDNLDNLGRCTFFTTLNWRKKFESVWCFSASVTADEMKSLICERWKHSSSSSSVSGIILFMNLSLIPRPPAEEASC